MIDPVPTRDALLQARYGADDAPGGAWPGSPISPGLPPHSVAVFGLCVGWPDPDRPSSVKPRLPQAAVLHRERHDEAGQAAALERFDAVSMAFQESQGMAQVPWTRQSASRMKGPETMSGRDRLRAALEALGLPSA